MFDEEGEEEQFKGGGSLLDDEGLGGSKVEAVQEGFVGSTMAMSHHRHLELQCKKTCHSYLTVKCDFPFIVI
jgi:hypothetical protein